MHHRILSGKPVVESIRADLSARLARLERTPSLSIYAYLDYPPSRTFVRRKVVFCSSLSIEVSVTDLGQMDTASAADAIRSDPADGILVQLPVPPHIDQDTLLRAVDPAKDVDGFCPKNLGDLLAGHPALVSCTASACDGLLRHYGVGLVGSHVVIVNDTLVLGKPLAALLNHRGATVTVANKYTRDLRAIFATADIIVSAVGRPPFAIGPDMVNPKQIVVDVAIVHDGNKIIGDLTSEAAGVVAGYTPVPGGVGPVTVACVAANLIRIMELSCGSQNHCIERVA